VPPTSVRVPSRENHGRRTGSGVTGGAASRLLKVWELWLESSDPEQTFGAYASDRIPALPNRL